MKQNQEEFVEFMLDNNALKFGDFTLKSGRKSPFFMNAGAYVSGKQLQQLARFYAKAIHDQFGEDFTLLFGPAYKGIPLAVATAQALYELYGQEVRYSSDRKELKDHGDAGGFLGSKPVNEDVIVMIEDVTTSGASMKETIPKILAQAPQAKIKGLMVSLNRGEKGHSDLSALEQIEKDYGIEARAIVSMPEVISYLKEKEALSPEQIQALREYYATYGSQPLDL